MADIISIDDLKKEVLALENQGNWQLFAEKQYALIETLQQEVKNLQFKNYQLENLISSKFNPDLAQHLSPEEIICIEQIERLQRVSSERALAIDEVKKLDLLVKNLKLIRDESTIILNNKAEGLKESDLVAIIRGDASKS